MTVTMVVGGILALAAMAFVLYPLFGGGPAPDAASHTTAPPAPACPSCGARLPLEARFCPGCGAPLRARLGRTG